MFASVPPFMRFSAMRNCEPEVPLMSPMARRPSYSGLARSAHEVGGVLICLVSYTMTVAPVMNTTYWPSLSSARGDTSAALASLLLSMVSSSFSFLICEASELSM